MDYEEDTLFGDNADETDDGRDGKDNKGKYCVISAIIRVRILTDNFLWMPLNCLKVAEPLLEDSLLFLLSLKEFLVLI